MRYKSSTPTLRKVVSRTPLPEVLAFAKDTPVWVLHSVGFGDNKRIIRLEGVVLAPKRTKVAVRFRRPDGAWDIKGIDVSKLERRVE